MIIRYTGDVKRDLYHEGRAFSLAPNGEFEANAVPKLPDFEEVKDRSSKPPSAEKPERNEA